MPLEDILQKHFGLKGNAYLKYPKVKGTCCGETEYEYMTKKGLQSYFELIETLNDINKLVPIANLSHIIDELDSLTYGEEFD